MADSATWEVPRPTAHGTRHAISAGHHLATAAGFAVLEAGGNAVDAGCAAGLALGVLHADEVNFAGVAPIMIRTGAGRVVTIDGVGTWPKGIPADLFMREHDGTMPIGVLRTVVPAAPDAWITALRDFGTMTFGEVAGAAVRLARDGFAVVAQLAAGIERGRPGYERWPSSAAIFLPGGRAPRVGERFLQRDLAATIEHMADRERAAAGDRAAGLEAARDAFYKGEIARRIAGYHAEHGSYLTYEDLASFRCRYEPPVATRWRELQLLTCGPWCQGPMLAQALLTVEAAGLAGLAHNGAGYVHTVVEALKGALSDREHHYGDPAFVEVDLDRLLSPAHAAARAAMIDPARAAAELPPPLFGVAQPLPSPRPLDQPSQVGERGTSYVCVVDRWGTAFSATPSDVSATAPVIPGTGIVPSTRGSQSRPDCRHPSGVAPGKRPRLTPNPAIAVRDDGSVLPFGCPGGDAQVQAMLQFVLNVFHFRMELQEAINAPRFASWSFPNSFAPFDYLPGRLSLESRIDPEVIDELDRLGHDVEVWPRFTREAAAVEAILLDRSTGFLHAGADPRQPASAIVS
jgi:gamma-glutamyltranspeptidase/glutathione hydrolase